MIADIIETIVDTIQGILAGIGTGITGYFESVFVTRLPGVDTILNTADDVVNLSNMGIFIFVLLGIGAAFGLATLVFNLVRHRS